MNGPEPEEESIHVDLPVRKSAISSVESGIARIHTSHMDMFHDQEEPMALVSYEKNNVVVKIVSDKLAPQCCITLRIKDIDDLEVEDGDMVRIEPYSKLTDEVRGKWKRFISKFRKNEDDDEEED